MQNHFSTRAAGVFCIIVASAILSACGGSGSQPESAGPSTTTTGVKANTVISTANPAGPVNVIVGASQQVVITFTTDDGAPATNLSDTGGLASLPAGWSSTTPALSCASATTGDSCRLTLTYAPTAATASSTLTVSYQYVDSTGRARTSSVDIAYAAASGPAATTRAYIVNFSDSTMTQCELESDGALSDCKNSGAFAITNPTSFAISGSTAYVLNSWDGKLMLCTIGATGGASGCADSGLIWSATPGRLAANNTHFYMTDMNGLVTVCEIGANGSLSNCKDSGTTFDVGVTSVSLNGSYAYVRSNLTVNRCTIGADGSFSGCGATGDALLNGVHRLAFHDNTAYGINFSNDTVIQCAIDAATGSLSSCANAGVPSLSGPEGITVLGSRIYIANYKSHTVTQCSIEADSTLKNCVNSGATSLNSPIGIQFR